MIPTDCSVRCIIIIWASQGFDRGLAAGEAIRRLMRQIANLNINAEDNLAYAA